MKKSTKADMGIRRRLYKLLQNGPQRRDLAVDGLEYGIVGINEASSRPGSSPFGGRYGDGAGRVP
jgi:acyl-CoA reductase-like NAD-dependent aldehyde dehydrogenase